MITNKKQTVCSRHNQPITKIQMNSRRLLCVDCLNEKQEDQAMRLEEERAQLTNKYKIALEQLKTIKKKLEKFAEMFITNNMMQVKRTINKSLPDVQKIIDNTIEKQLLKANDELQEFIQKKLAGWQDINGNPNTFSARYLQFQEFGQQLQQQIEQQKQQKKRIIIQCVKEQVHKFYQGIFQF